MFETADVLREMQKSRPEKVRQSIKLFKVSFSKDFATSRYCPLLLSE